MITKDEVAQAISYTFKSPFVRKIVGINAQGDQDMFDNEVADEIHASSPLLNDLRKEHEKARDILATAGQEDPTQFIQILTEHIKSLANSCQEKVDAAQKELDELPKIDEEFVAGCHKFERELLEKKDVKRKKIEDAVEQKYNDDLRISKRVTIVCALILVVGVLWSMYAFRNGENSPIVLVPVIMCFGGLIGILTGIVSIAIQVFQNKKSKRNGTYQKYIDNAMASTETEIARELEIIHQLKSKGYSDESDFGKRIHIAEVKLLAYKLHQSKTHLNIAYFSEKIKDDPIQAFPKLLEKAINNMDSLSKWAVNYIHEKKLAEHYSEMESIEKDKLRAQEIAHESQVEAARAQQILLQQQTDAIKAQANAAEQQAKAVQQQARDTEEIKRRLENEKYGDIRRRYAGEKFPWEK